MSYGDVEDSWAIEVDQATESLPTLHRKLKAYLDLAANDEHGPKGGPLPRVLVTVPSEHRLKAVHEVLGSLPEVANELFAVTVHKGAVEFITQTLRE